MKKILLLPLLFLALPCYAEDAKKPEEWQNTTISDETIQKIQTAQYEYKKCVSDEMQKEQYTQQDSKSATNDVIKECEPSLTKMREIYTDEGVPEVISDRHLKQMRVQVTRNVLQSLMYSEAARAAGNPRLVGQSQ
jgi:phosphatidate phosphatase PAH1